MSNSYNKTKDAYSHYARAPESVALDAAVIAPSDAANLSAYAKALRIYVPSTMNAATLRVTPLQAVDDANTVTLSYTSGVHYEPLSVRKVWTTGTSAGIEIHGYTV